MNNEIKEICEQVLSSNKKMENLIIKMVYNEDCKTKLLNELEDNKSHLTSILKSINDYETAKIVKCNIDSKLKHLDTIFNTTCNMLQDPSELEVYVYNSYQDFKKSHNEISRDINSKKIKDLLDVEYINHVISVINNTDDRITHLLKSRNGQKCKR